MADFATGFNKLLGVLRDLGIPHAVGGSLASSVHGSARTTVDIDIVARFDGARLDDFVARLETDFSLAPEAIFEAVRAGRPFNLIHVDSAYKFDLFPVPADPYYRQALERRLPAQLSLAGEVVSFPVVTAEDSILTKLVWYRSGGEVSERQLNDIKGILAVQEGRLDHPYLQRWASHLGVTDLLESLI